GIHEIGASFFANSTEGRITHILHGCQQQWKFTKFDRVDFNHSFFLMTLLLFSERLFLILGANLKRIFGSFSAFYGSVLQFVTSPNDIDPGYFADGFYWISGRWAIYRVIDCLSFF